MANTIGKSWLVAKVGGALLKDGAALQSVLQVLQQLQTRYAVVLVHGGGDTTQALLEALDFSSEKIDGVRVTPKAHIPYVVGALAGTVNSEICAQAKVAGLNPVGLTLLDGGMCKAQITEPRFGSVGKVSPADSNLLTMLSNGDYLPVVASIACDEVGNLLNVNADDAAAVVAQLLSAELLLLSDVAGVLDQDKQLISQLDSAQISSLTEQNVIQGGMVVKVNSALATANQTQKSVFISSWKTPEQMLALLKGQSCGTCIVPNLQADSSKGTSL
ncbi:acetylglutamate kinase [Planctobacterium marinum]|uniref:Acetylglutamate kinase n=2 Tax=Planctobacterium marinum TaxID=1631968 RepID=A0AA48HJX6_9ALTE|nr:acetylglutamate kinase [Planctobacterium marinum]